jgi:uncharacterized membrane protein YccF (DUF307 family)
MIKIPFGIDSSNGDKPSITLLFAVIAFVIAGLSVIVNHFLKCGTATFYSILFWTIATAFYKMKDIDKLKISKDSVEIDDDQPSSPRDEVR